MEMDDSQRFVDQSKALWLQNNNESTIMSKKPKNTCVGRCPFASIIATIITFMGTGVFCGCLYRALAISVDMFTSAFRIQFEIEWIKIIQTVIIIISAVMCGLAIILLIVGCLATGATRTQIYTGFRSRLGGRISTGFFTSIVYLLFLVWFLITCTLVIPMIAYYMIVKNCEFKKSHIENPISQKVDECLSLLTFDLITFCNQANEAGPLYIAAFVSSVLIVIGLVHYLCCLVANYAHIKDGMKLKDYEEAIKEEMEFTARKREL